MEKQKNDNKRIEKELSWMMLLIEVNLLKCQNNSN